MYVYIYRINRAIKKGEACLLGRVRSKNKKYHFILPPPNTLPRGEGREYAFIPPFLSTFFNQT